MTGARSGWRGRIAANSVKGLMGAAGRLQTFPGAEYPFP
jgi:hypothetical protein